jgi:PAS domain S-box-containing protein
MAKDFFLYQVGRLWYRLYWALSLVCSIAVFAVFVVAQFSTHVSQYATTYSIGHTAFIMSCASLMYLLIAYWPVARYSLPFGTLVASMVLTLQLLNGLANTTNTTANYVYVVLWLISTFLVGSFGMPLLLGGTFVTFIYITLHSNFQPANVSRGSWILLIGTLVIALSAYLFYRRRFVSVQEEQVDQLSGMLKTNQQQSVILIQSIADGVIVVDTEGKITLMNPAAAAMTEWQIADAVGVDAQLVAKLSNESGEEILPEDNPFAQVIKQQKHVNQTLLLTGRDGKSQTVSLVISPVTDPNTNTLFGAVAVMRDISEERAAEKQRADFISTASHEMRTPVAAIEGYLALALNEKVSTIDTRARGYLEKAHTSTQHLGKLFQDLLTSSKAEDGRLSNHPQVVEMGAYLQQLTDDLKFAAEKKGLFVDFLVGSSNDAIDATNKDTVNTHVLKPLYYVLADPDRMREVITNLFDNACKYTEQGKISIGLTGDNDVVQLYVRDTGAGIPADDIPHLFQKFYRVDNSATRTIGGTGLGLFICRKIVELYKGRIWVESELSKGSTFFINLPRLSIQRAEALQAAEESKATGAPTPGASAKA